MLWEGLPNACFGESGRVSTASGRAYIWPEGFHMQPETALQQGYLGLTFGRKGLLLAGNVSNEVFFIVLTFGRKGFHLGEK